MKKIRLLFLTLTTLLCADTQYPSYHPAVANGVNIWIEADLLYWRPWEKALVATNKKSNVFVTDNFTKAPVSHPHFEWSLGYRVSSGYLFPCNLWDIEGSWTHWMSHVSQHRSSDGSAFVGMFPIWSLSKDVIAGDYVFESHLKWRFTLNILDVQCGRYLTPISWFDFKPYFGIRSAWIKQDGKVVYEGGMFLIGIVTPGVSLNGSDVIHMENHYWGMGPRVGIAPRFILGKGFMLHADAAFSGLYGVFKVRQKEHYLDTTRSFHHRHFARFRWIGDFATGLQWKKPLYHDRYALTFKVDWEYHLFFHQFEFKKDKFHLIPNHRNLSIQGVTFSGRFDF